MRHQVFRLESARTLRDITDLKVEREFVRVVGGQGGKLINIHAAALSETQAPWLATGFKFQGTGSGWLLEDCTATGFRTRPKEGKTYWQGDGFATELKNDSISFVRCVAKGCGDGGFDLKGPRWDMKDCSAASNAKNYRFWSGGHANSLVSMNPTFCHLHICIAQEHGERQTIRIDSLFAEGNKPLLFIETSPKSLPPRIEIKRLEAYGISSFVKIVGEPPDISWP